MRSKIEENWSKINEVEDFVKAQTGDPEAGFSVTSFCLDGLRRIFIPCMYRGTKTRKGEKVFNQTYKNFQVEILYCPFTGRPLFKDEDKGVSSAKMIR